MNIASTLNLYYIEFWVRQLHDWNRFLLYLSHIEINVLQLTHFNWIKMMNYNYCNCHLLQYSISRFQNSFGSPLFCYCKTYFAVLLSIYLWTLRKMSIWTHQQIHTSNKRPFFPINGINPNRSFAMSKYSILYTWQNGFQARGVAIFD